MHLSEYTKSPTNFIFSNLFLNLLVTVGLRLPLGLILASPTQHNKELRGEQEFQRSGVHIYRF